MIALDLCQPHYLSEKLHTDKCKDRKSELDYMLSKVNVLSVTRIIRKAIKN